MSEIDHKLLDLIGEYFDLGYAEGAAGRDSDTMAGDAQLVLSEITTLIQSQAAEIERLTRERDTAWESREWHRVSLEAQTENLIEARADLARAREALKPFAKLGAEAAWMEKRDDKQAWGFDGVDLTWGDFRRARAALPSTTGEAE